MRYYKVTDENGKLLRIGTGEGGEEITAAEHARLLEEIKNTPFVIPEAAEEAEQ